MGNGSHNFSELRKWGNAYIKGPETSQKTVANRLKLAAKT